MKNLKTLTVLAAAIALVLMSCGAAEQNEFLTDREDTKDTVKGEVLADMATIRAKIPQPSVLGKKFAAAGLSYNKSSMLSSSKASGFSGNYGKAMGLGAFGADLGFACAYNQTQDALEYLNGLSKLANDLGIGSSFDPEFVKQLLSSLGKSDTLDMMINKAYDKAERNMQSNQRTQLAVLMICGGWIEGIYVAAENINIKKDDPKAKGLYHDLYEHAYTVNYIKELLTAYKGNADIDKFAAELKPFEPAFNAANKPTFGPADLDALRKAITDLRSKVL
jgi:hypothetical protein